MEAEIVEPTEILGGPTNLEGLNKKAIQKLSDLLDNLSPKSDPDMITAVTDAVAKLNNSLKNSDIIQKEETEAERRDRETKEALANAMRG